MRLNQLGNKQSWRRGEVPDGPLGPSAFRVEQVEERNMHGHQSRRETRESGFHEVR